MNHRPSTRIALTSATLALLALLIPLRFLSTEDRAVGQEAPALKKVVPIEGITEYQLNNGLRVLLFPDPSAANVTVNLTVFVGSRHEGYGETGMAHLLEHMVFKGTPSHRDIPKLLKEHGARFNGPTWVDRTNSGVGSSDQPPSSSGVGSYSGPPLKTVTMSATIISSAQLPPPR